MIHLFLIQKASFRFSLAIPFRKGYQQAVFFTLIFLGSISSLNARNTPIDEFLKKYPSKEGMTNVSVSQPMLQSIFDSSSPKKTNQSNEYQFFYGTDNRNLNVPEAYNSISVTRNENIPAMTADFRKILVTSKYEPYMEVNKDNNNILCYYFKKTGNNTNEIVVLRQQKETLSAIYIKGDIEMGEVDTYLRHIRYSLKRLEANGTDVFSLPPVAFNAPFLHDFHLNLENMKTKVEDIDFESIRRNMEESMKSVKEQLENMKLTDSVKMFEWKNDNADSNDGETTEE